MLLLLLTSFAGSDSASTWQEGDEKKEKMARGVTSDYSRKAIILNISIKGGRLFEGRD